MSIESWNLINDTKQGSKSISSVKSILEQTSWDRNRMPKGYRKEQR